MTADGGQARERAVLVTRNLPPLRGGMERLNLHVAIALSRRFALTVVGPAGCARFLPQGIEVREVPSASLPVFLAGAVRATWAATSRPARLVLAGSGLTAPIAALAARRCGGASGAYVHGLDLVTRHPAYRAAWVPCMRRLGLAVANSANTAAIARDLGVAGGNIAVVHPGTHLPPADDGTGEPLPLRSALGDGPLLLSVGRLTGRKGIAEFIEHSLPRIALSHPDVRLVIIGDNAPDALNRSRTDPRRRLDQAIARAGMAEHVVVLGPCDDRELSQAYAAADLHVFPVRHVPGDVEGFGMVAVEAAAHGLPTVAFATGGVPDAVADRTSGRLVAPGDYDAFSRQVCELLASDRAGLRESTRGFAQRFGWDRFDTALLAALDRGLAAARA